ncbi:unnamed protein product [Lactuca saligna]|uniref:Replication factor A C-terminal domain-containing protein n=1 Tax=Lactuca saligna TaxID=75948 RepID=A0AA36EPY8_LACSI|nr:unnamed protein product [Lactuca saligna]
MVFCPKVLSSSYVWQISKLGWSASKDYYLHFPIKNIDDIPDYNKEISLSIIATIIGFDLNEDWYSFYCCDCSKKLSKNDDETNAEPFNCDGCGGVSDVYSKVGVVIRVQYETESASFVLFDRHVKNVIHQGSIIAVKQIDHKQLHQSGWRLVQAEKEMGEMEVWDDKLLEGVVFGIDLQVHYLASFCRSSTRHRFATPVSPSKSVGVWYKSISFFGTRGRRRATKAGDGKVSNGGR